jgi:hypothetical protein
MPRPQEKRPPAKLEVRSCLGVLAVVPGAHHPDPIRWIKPGLATVGHVTRHTLS